MMKIYARKERGFVLVVSMIFLIVMTLLSITAINKATLGEKISGNLRSQEIAFESAEKGLRFCERQIDLAAGSKTLGQLRLGSTVTIHESGLPNPANALENFPQEWAQLSNWGLASTKATTLPANTADSMKGVVEQPKCMIERWSVLGSRSDGIDYAYVVTSRGVGNVDSAVVMLQTVIRLGNY